MENNPFNDALARYFYEMSAGDHYQPHTRALLLRSLERSYSTGLDLVNWRSLENLRTILMACCQHRTDPMTRLMIQEGADIGASDMDGLTALAFASIASNYSALPFLTDSANVNTASFEILWKQNGFTTLIYACVKGNSDFLLTLLSIPGVDINYRHPSGHTALMMAVGSGKCDIVQVLLSHPGIDVNTTDPHSQNCLHMAIAQESVEIVELLLSHPSMNVNYQSTEGCTALMCACSFNRRNIVQILLSTPDINIELTDNEGHTARDIALLHNHASVVSLLDAERS